MMGKIEYGSFKIPKRTGGFRKIEYPKEPGMTKLRGILDDFSKKNNFRPSYFAHGFCTGRNIVTCAKQHYGNKYLLRIDIKDIFNSIKWSTFAFDSYMLKQKDINNLLLCFKDGIYLAQGAPTSPLLSNTYMRTFDWKCAWYCSNFNVVYNRYADDIFISAKKIDSKFWSCQKYISEMLDRYGFKENKKKRKLMHPGKRMEVVGIVINEKFQVNRKTRRLIRAMLHNAKRDGKKLTASQKGLLNFKNMVDQYPGEKPNSVEICQSILVANKI